MKIEAITMAGNTNPTKGTKIDGRYAALIISYEIDIKIYGRE